MPEKTHASGKAKAILKAKCPRCRRGNIFPHSAYHKSFYQTHRLCPHCGMMFEREPGFFLGAMYISYVFSVAILLGTSFVLYFVFGDPPFIAYLIGVPLVSLLFVPLSFRYSRVIFLYAFGGVGYQKTFAEDPLNSK